MCARIARSLPTQGGEGGDRHRDAEASADRGYFDGEKIKTIVHHDVPNRSAFFGCRGRRCRQKPI